MTDLFSPLKPDTPLLQRADTELQSVLVCFRPKNVPVQLYHRYCIHTEYCALGSTSFHLSILALGVRVI